MTLFKQLELDLAQDLLVGFGEAAALGDQGLDPGVAVQVERIDPGELVPDLQVAQIVDARSARPPRGAPPPVVSAPPRRASSSPYRG